MIAVGHQPPAGQAASWLCLIKALTEKGIAIGRCAPRPCGAFPQGAPLQLFAVPDIYTTKIDLCDGTLGFSGDYAQESFLRVVSDIVAVLFRRERRLLSPIAQSVLACAGRFRRVDCCTH